jgi:hypothetical protein
MMRIFVIVLLTVGLRFGVAAQARTISQVTARRLVHLALAALNQEAPSVRVEHFRYDYAPEFYAFAATWPNPNGDPLIGYFAVNPWTGDVWEINLCKRITSPELKREREAIWKRSALMPQAESTLHEKSPACSEVDLKNQGRPK